MQQSGSEAIYLRSRMMGKETVSIHLMLDEKTGMDYPHEGSLKFSEVTIDETTGSIALRALIPNPDSLLLPGLFVRAMLDLGQDDVLLVPQRATIRTPEGDLTVWVVDESGKAQPRPVKVEQAYTDNWIVKDGLKAGDTIIVEGYQKVGPGAPVSSVPWQQSETSGGKEYNLWLVFLLTAPFLHGLSPLSLCWPAFYRSAPCRLSNIQKSLRPLSLLMQVTPVPPPKRLKIRSRRSLNSA
jgi:hypothetical protein